MNDRWGMIRIALGRLQVLPMPAHPRAVRAGVVAMCFGGFVAGISSMQLAMVGMQRLFLRAMPHQPGDEWFRTTMQSMAELMSIYMPAFVVLGATMLWQGNRLRKGARDAASWLVALGLVAMGLVAVYGRDSYAGPMRLFEQGPRNPTLPVDPHTWSLISLVGGGAMAFAPLLAVIILAWQARSAPQESSG
ncbi:MAG: hypothetical protein JST54_02500 [Deltaproteobacteria bacterium]|nr:hypothetical protein [Deltaproteobacteria bacterium]